jgi:hydrogenase maturation protease
VIQPVTPPVLLIGIGNPSRGDDALGPLCIEGLEALNLPQVELLTDFQLQVEFALDLEGRREVVFIDAAATGPEPYDFRPVGPAEGLSHTSHALSPEAVVAACHRVGVKPPTEAHVLAIRGYGFELGEGLSEAATSNLEAALSLLRGKYA